VAAEAGNRKYGTSFPWDRGTGFARPPVDYGKSIILASDWSVLVT